MSRRRHVSILAVVPFALFLAGCTSFARVPPSPAHDTPPCDTTGVVYSRSYFQARYQGKFIASMILGGPVLAGALMSQSQDVDHTEHRMTSGPFERLLGEFDALGYVNREAIHALSQARLFLITLSTDPAVMRRIVDEARSLEAAKPAHMVPPDRSRNCIAAFKVTYGLGARAGTEQLGLRKSYRPFVHIVGAVYGVDSKRVLWRDAMIAFGSVRYLGGDAEPDRIQSRELVEGLQAAGRDALGLIVRSLNGYPITERAMLVVRSPRVSSGHGA